MFAGTLGEVGDCQRAWLDGDTPLDAFPLAPGRFALRMECRASFDGSGLISNGYERILVYDTRQGSVASIEVGETHSGRMAGCTAQSWTHVIAGDWNKDGALELGIERVSVRCEPCPELRDASYNVMIRRPIEWYGENGAGFVRAPEYDGSVPASIQCLPEVPTLFQTGREFLLRENCPRR